MTATSPLPGSTEWKQFWKKEKKRKKKRKKEKKEKEEGAESGNGLGRRNSWLKSNQVPCFTSVVRLVWLLSDCFWSSVICLWQCFTFVVRLIWLLSLLLEFYRLSLVMFCISPLSRDIYSRKSDSTLSVGQSFDRSVCRQIAFWPTIGATVRPSRGLPSAA